MPYSSRHSDTIARLMMERGRAAGDARLQSGQAWGNAIAGIGQTVDRSLAGLIREREEAPRRAFEAAQMQDAQEQMTARKAMQAENARIGALMNSALTQTEDGRPTVDRRVLLAGMQEQGLGHRLPDITAMLDKVDPPKEQFTLNPGDVRFDATGKRIAGVDKPADPFTLNPGDVRFGPDGKQVASLPALPPPVKQFEVTVPGPNGQPIRRLATEAEMQQGVREYRAPVAPTQEPLEAVIGPDGNPVLLPRSQARGMRPATTREQPTEDERKTAGFYSQMSDAVAIMDDLEGKLSEKELYQIQTLPQEGLIGMANRGELSENAKRYLQAFEQFTESRLRPVSGATITDQEFARDRRTYARQFGETEALAQQRKQSRTRALESLKARAARALPKDAGSRAPQAPAGWKYVPKPGGGWTAVEDK